MNTKTCPDCKKNVNRNDDTCECGYDFTAEECPGCDRKVPATAPKCPHCGYNFLGDSTPKKEPKAPKTPKAPKEPKKTKVKEEKTKVKEEKTKVKEEKQEGRRPPMPQGYRGVVWVPALGRPCGAPPLDFPELHWKGTKEPTDEELVRWVDDLRYAYADHDGGCYLSNHAVSYLVSHEETLNKYTGIGKRLMALLGGDDWK